MPASERPVARADVIDGLGKGLRVIEAFDDAHPRLTPSQAGERAGISRTAARRYLLSLMHFGYAETDGKLFWLTARVLRLGQSYLEAARLPRIVQPFIQRLSMATGETVNMSVLDGHEVVYVARSNAPRFVSIGYHVGARVPAHGVTPGVVILATWADDEALDAWIAEHDFARYTAHTVTEREQFRAEVVAARAQGYWIIEQQLDLGLVGIGLALKDRRGQCHGALSMTVPAQTHSTATMTDQLLPLLQDTAQVLRPLL
jgi:IclR family pca regulon transcriptional regulator